MDKTADKVLDFFHSIDELVFCLFMFFMPFGWGASVLPLMLFISLQFIAVFKEGRYPTRRKLLFFAPIFFYFGWSLLSLTWTLNVGNGIQIIGQQVSFFLIPFTFLFLKPDMVLVRKGIRFFIVGLLLSSLLLISKAFLQSVSFAGGSIVFNTAFANGVAGVFDSSVKGNYFLGVDFSTLMHPSYFGIMLACGILYLIWGAIPGSIFTINMKFSSLCMIVFASVLILLSTNAVVIMTALLLFMWVFVHFRYYSHHSWSRILSAFFGVLCLILLCASPQARYLIFGGGEGVLTNKWHLIEATFVALQNNFIIGYGVGSEQQVLNEVLNVEYPSLVNLNPHNQYMHTWLSLGVVGLIFLNWIWFNVLYIGIKRNIFLMVGFAVVSLVSFSFESMLYRYWGVVFFATFYSLIYFYNDYNEDDTQLVRVRYRKNKLVRVD